MRKRFNSFLLNNQVLDVFVSNNLNNLGFRFLYLPFFLLLLIVFYLFKEDAFSFEGYVNTQKELFFYLNSKLSQFPNLQINLTQLGDVVIFLPFLTIFLVVTPKFWETLLSSLIISGIITNITKSVFAMPRPAAMLDNNSFVIIGDTLTGNNSLPSGHSIATFAIITTVFFAFMPKKRSLKFLWFFLVFVVGFTIAFSRVGVGAHYPFDVVTGSIIGYISAIVGAVISKKYTLWNWVTSKKYYLITISLFSICAVAIINKIISTNLIIFYFSLVSLLATTFLIIYIYAKKKF